MYSLDEPGFLEAMELIGDIRKPVVKKKHIPGLTACPPRPDPYLAADPRTQERLTKAIAKGERLLALMDCPNVPDSRWTDPRDLEAWGYHAGEIDITSWPWWIDRAFDEAFDELQFTKSHRKNYIHIETTHKQDTEHNSTCYPATLGSFDNAINLRDGTIVRLANFGPKTNGLRRKPPVTVIPELQHWSDIVFLKWKQKAALYGKEGRNLGYIFATGISNVWTIEVLNEVVPRYADREICPFFDPSIDGDSLPWENRVTIDTSEPLGKALLATDNGRGGAYLLIDHKSVFGQRSTIWRITFWCIMSEVHLMFHVRQQD